MTQPQRNPQLDAVAAAALGAAAITQRTADATAAVIAVLWRQVDPYNPGEVAEFAQQAGQLLVSSQRIVANAHTAAQLLQLQAVGINQPVTVTVPDNVRGATADFAGRVPKVTGPRDTTLEYDDGGKQTVARTDSAPDRLMERAAEKYRYERSVGKDPEIANGLAEQKIADLVDSNMILSARLAQQQTLRLVQAKDARVIGWRRVIHPELSKGGVCGLCVAAADRVYKISELRPIHDRCKCTIAAVTTEHDPGYTLNQDDLDRLYVHAAETAPTETVYGYERQALSTSAKALKKTRYQIVHHNEYGPVLTRVPGKPLPYASTEPPTAAA